MWNVDLKLICALFLISSLSFHHLIEPFFIRDLWTNEIFRSSFNKRSFSMGKSEVNKIVEWMNHLLVSYKWKSSNEEIHLNFWVNFISIEVGFNWVIWAGWMDNLNWVPQNIFKINFKVFLKNFKLVNFIRIFTFFWLSNNSTNFQMEA